MYKLIRDLDEAKKELSRLDITKLLFCDTETCKQDGYTDGGLYGQVRLFQVYQYGWKEAIMFDLFFIDQDWLYKKVWPYHHVYHNASYDLHTINCHTETLYLPEYVDDTFYLAKATFTDKDKFTFYDCLNHAKLTDDFIRSIDKKENQKSDWGGVLTETMLKYAAADVLYLSLLWKAIDGNQDRVYKMDIANLKYAVNYDRRGIPMNSETISKLRKKTLLKLEKNQALVNCNINSPLQCKKLLGIESTTAAILGDLALAGKPNSDTARALVNARVAYKFLGFLNSYDHYRVRGFHNAAGARTGRMTCTGGDRYKCANTQQPPRKMLQCIEAKPGNKFIYNDYSGLELRIAVSLVGEPTMERVMREDGDLHAESASVMFSLPPGDLDIEQRTVGKFFNFGTAYGAGPGILRDGLISRGNVRLPIDEINRMRLKWLDHYSYFKEWHAMHKRHFNIYGYLDVTTGMGRVIRANRLNDSFNYSIQGTAAECTKFAVHLLHERYGDPGIVNVVHDSICLEQPEAEAEQWVERMNECMIEAWYESIKNFAIPDMPMPKEAELKQTWAKLDV